MRKIFAIFCHHFSLAKFSLVRYIMKKQTLDKNVLLINKNLENIILWRGYTGIN